MQIGSTVGNYKITALLGEGGMGEVYVAEHPLIGKKVALKVLRRELARDPEAVARFFTEARAVVRVGHENIVDISDFGQTPDGECYFIMELLAGAPLASRLENGQPMPWAESLHVAAQVASALAGAHGHRILHRDLKPDNIFLVRRGSDPLFVKVLDFGLAKLSDDAGESVKTKSGMVMGTPYYMSPEQAEGASDIDARTDIYALGVILYQCLTGKVPFTGNTFAQILVKHMTTEPVAPRRLNPAIPEAIEPIVLKAMAKARDQRFQSMAELREALLAVAERLGGRLGSSSRITAVPMTPGPAAGMGSQPTIAAPTPVPRTGSAPAMPSPGLAPAHPSTLGAAAGVSMNMASLTQRGTRTGLIAGVVGGVTVVGVVIALAVGHGGHKTAAAAPAAAPPVAVAPVAAPVHAPPPPPAAVPQVVPRPAAPVTPGPAPVAAATPPSPAPVHAATRPEETHAHHSAPARKGPKTAKETPAAPVSHSPPPPPSNGGDVLIPPSL